MKQLALVCLLAFTQSSFGQEQNHRSIALTNGMWFNGQEFVPKTMYSVDGYFTTQKPSTIDTTIDLTGKYVIPPFGEAHNHNLNGGNEANRDNIKRYLRDGVFYVKLQSNFPITDEEKRELRLNTPYSIDVTMAQGASLCTTGGHPYGLGQAVWLRFGYAKGPYANGPIEALNGHRFYTIDNDADLEEKWPKILEQRPDFIKATLWHTDEFEKRRNDTAYFGQYGLREDLFRKIVAKAHQADMKVSTHINNAYDFHVAADAGVDEICHLPVTGLTPIDVEDLRLAVSRGIVVITTCKVVSMARAELLPGEQKRIALEMQRINLERVREHGVTLAIGSDLVNDSSVEEIEYLRSLNIFSNLELLKMWTEVTAKAIFPDRKIGILDEGYEASFIALEENPLDGFGNTRKIALRFKQGRALEDY